MFSFFKEYQTFQRSIINNLQKLPDHNLLLSSDVQATEYFQKRYNHLKEVHLHLEEKINHLRVCFFKKESFSYRKKEICFLMQERINVSLSINVKIDDNIRQIKRKLILYETDLHRLKTEIPSTISDKRIRAELAVVSFL